MTKKKELKKRIEFAERRLDHFTRLRDFWEKKLEYLEELLEQLPRA